MDRLKKVLYGPPLLLPFPEGSLGKILQEKINQYRDRTAFIDEFTGESLTYDNLLSISHRLADAFRNLNIQTNDRIVIAAENNIYFYCPVLAALYRGVITAPLCHQYFDDDILKELLLVRPKIIFSSRQNYRNYLDLRRNLPFIEHIVILDFEEASEGVESLRTFIDRYASNGREGLDNLDIPEFDIDDQVAFIIFSSGITDFPKGVMITHRNAITICIHLNDPSLGFHKATETYLCVMPYSHIFGFVTALSLLYSGLTGAVFSTFTEKAFLEALEKYRISRICLVSALVTLLAKSPLVERYDLSNLKEITCGNDPINEDTEQRVRERLNVDSIHLMYGMTETTFLVTSIPPFEERRGSVGKVLPAMSAIIRDPDTGENLGPNQIGEICFKGDVVMKGYYGNSKATRETFTDDGWLRTGDLGYFDDDEYLFVVDRLKELIKYKGFQVAPAELEGLLLRHPKIKECGVVGLPDDVAGELPMAFVVKQNDVDITEQEIIDYVAGHVSEQKKLRGGVRFIDEIPKNASGKMLRRVLRLLVHEMRNR